jgi:hypothetical protein
LRLEQCPLRRRGHHDTDAHLARAVVQALGVFGVLDVTDVLAEDDTVGHWWPVAIIALGRSRSPGGAESARSYPWSMGC